MSCLIPHKKEKLKVDIWVDYCVKDTGFEEIYAFQAHFMVFEGNRFLGGEWIPGKFNIEETTLYKYLKKKLRFLFDQRGEFDDYHIEFQFVNKTDFKALKVKHNIVFDKIYEIYRRLNRKLDPLDPFEDKRIYEL